ncbi:MAG: hypothetical protein DRO98_05910 [Archaeoglobales archaeon]|nr:MAG: hypothetical protein DRO98_05910 [Archaeoglobales archaeon]
MKRMKVLSVVLLFAVAICGCSQPEEKLPAVKVEFMHYNITGVHVLKINDAKATYINLSEAPEKIYNPSDVPFPGIHVFAYFSKGVTPITWVPINAEGDNITAYIGFRSREDVPKKGETLIVVVDAVDRMGKSYAEDSTRVVWDPK